MADSASLVTTSVVLTAIEALEAIASSTGGTLRGLGTADAHVALPDDSIARVSVSKFGDEVPITIDITSLGNAVVCAARVRGELEVDPGWRFVD
jgi:hypothetical protein